MENQIKVSIIVPVYNTEMYLETCLNSLLNQTMKEIEIICINDGSGDRSAEILESFSKKDSRIKVLTQQNQGQSAARNNGMNQAKGEYVGFVDSDDWADEKMFEKLYDKAKQFDSDLTMCSVAVYDEKTGKTSTNDPYLTLNLFPESYFYKTFTYQDCLDFLFRICVVPWNKIYKTSWLKEKNIEFLAGVNFEDMVFAVETLIGAKKISLVDEPLVFYRKESKTSYSVGNFEKDYKKMDFFKIYEELERVLKSNSVFEPLKEYFSFYKKNNLIYWYGKIGDKNVKKQYYRELVKIYPDFRFQKIKSFLKKFKLKREIKKLAKTKRIIAWGAGTFVRSVLPKQEKNILGYVDNNIELKGKTIDGYEVYAIENLKELNPDCVLAITQNYYKFGKLVKTKLEDSGLNFEIAEFIV